MYTRLGMKEAEVRRNRAGDFLVYTRGRCIPCPLYSGRAAQDMEIVIAGGLLSRAKKRSSRSELVCCSLVCHPSEINSLLQYLRSLTHYDVCFLPHCVSMRARSKCEPRNVVSPNIYQWIDLLKPFWRYG